MGKSTTVIATSFRINPNGICFLNPVFRGKDKPVTTTFISNVTEFVY
jgi:hypothetical protein